jgi:hypothetical protein
MKLIKETKSKLKYGVYHKFAIFECPDCGNKFEHNISDITSGRKRNCGCKWSLKPLGDVVNGIIVLKDLGVINGRRNALFQCSLCTNTFSAIVERIKAGKTRMHCGCYVKPVKEKPIKEAKPEIVKWTNHPLYSTWMGIRKRCYNPNHHNYRNYGERGIKMCDRWFNSFLSFVDDMGDKPTPSHTIDRIDNDGMYEPSNCKWSTMKEQAANKRPPVYRI